MINVHNKGIGGDNSRNGVSRFERDVPYLNPDIVLIYFGINDVLWEPAFVDLEDFIENLSVMIRKAKSANIVPVVSTIHCIVETEVYKRHRRNLYGSEGANGKIARYNRALYEWSQYHEIPLIDFGRSLATSCLPEAELLRGDGVHLTSAGNRLLANCFFNSLPEAGREVSSIVCFGDSITMGTGVIGSGTAKGETYPAYLWKRLNPAMAPQKESEDSVMRLTDVTRPGWSLKVRLFDEQVIEFSSSEKRPELVKGGGQTMLTWSVRGRGIKGCLTVQVIRAPRCFGSAWRLNVKNSSDGALWEVTFPIFKSPIQNDDFIVLPACSGRLVSASKPLCFKPEGPRGYSSGPHTMQCSGFYGRDGGVYISSQDPFGSIKTIEVESKDNLFALCWHWPVPNRIEQGNSWEMPGDVLIRSFQGDWYDIAQIYREWASERALWWPRGDQGARPDTPEWFKDIAVWIQDGGPWPREEPLVDQNLVVSRAMQFAEYMEGIPCALHWYNWHQIPFDTDYPHFFPAKEGFVEGVRELQNAGLRVMPYINAHIWDTGSQDFLEKGLPAAVKSLDGEVPTKRYAGRDHAPMCPTMPLWQQVVKDLVFKLASPEFGVDAVYLDQISAQAPMQCYDRDHGHSLGGGCYWTTQGNWPMLDEIRSKLPGVPLASENTAEIYVNRLDGFLAWLIYREGNEAIPLFHAVYGGEVQIFGRLYKGESWKGAAMRTKTAQALVWGEQLGWIRPVILDEPQEASFLKRLARLRYQLRHYLSRGRMARPPKVETDGSTITANWVIEDDFPVTTPAVFSGAWFRNDEKALAVILINADEKEHVVTLSFDAGSYEISGRLYGRQWTASEKPIKVSEWQPIAKRWSREIGLAPMEALAFEIRWQE